MEAVIVYESLWGNTAAVARAVAQGIGPEARAMSTAEATPEIVASAGLLVVGAPVHISTLPSAKTRAKAAERAEDPERFPGLSAPDLSHSSVRDWLAELPRRKGAFGAAFDTRSPGKWTGSAARSIAGKLKRRGYRQVASPEGFVVMHQDGPLADGELERAAAWGAQLRAAMERA